MVGVFNQPEFVICDTALLETLSTEEIASGFAETEEVKAAQALGAGDYIKKPYTLEKIGIAVMNELGNG